MRGRHTAAATTCALVVALVALAMASCGTVSSPLPAEALPLPPVVATPNATSAASPAPAPDCGDPRASLRPPAVMPAPGAMPAGSHMQTIAQRGFLTVGVLSDVPPFGSIDPVSRQFVGFDVEIAKAIGRAIFDADDKVKFRAVTYAERVPVVRDGVVDIVVATMTTNCERRAQVDFSSVYYDAAQRVLVMRNSPYGGLDDLGGRKVCAAAGTTSIDNVAEAASRPVPYPVANVADCLLALQTGEVAGVSTTDAILAGMADQDPRTHIVGPKLSDEPDAIAISLEHPEMTRFVNGVLAGLQQDGTWMSLSARWLGSLRPPPVPPQAVYRD